MKRLIALMIVLLLVVTVASGEEKHDGWAVTQYVDVSGGQAMCYSIVKGNTLILIDGGWVANSEQVKSIIEANGGKVDYWFLTHYHPDHIGAFNALYEEYKDKIGTIYTTPIDWETYEPRAHEWDDVGTFATFLEITKGAKNIVSLHRGDELEIEGLKVKVFNAFDEHVQELSNDWLNDCSLIMKFSGAETSFLFLADLSRAAV